MRLRTDSHGEHRCSCIGGLVRTGIQLWSEVEHSEQLTVHAEDPLETDHILPEGAADPEGGRPDSWLDGYEASEARQMRKFQAEHSPQLELAGSVLRFKLMSM